MKTTIGNKIGSKGVSRRTFLQVTAAGTVAVSATGGSALFAGAAQAADPFTWISPRGTLEVLDDYGYWVGKKMGYFGDLETEMQPGPSDGTATVKFVAVGQADMGFPSPGVFSFAIENDMNLVSVFNMGAVDVFNFAFRKGEGVTDLKELEGKTVLLGSAAWQSIADPMFAAAGADPKKIKYHRGRLAAMGYGSGYRRGRCRTRLGRSARRLAGQGSRLRILARPTTLNVPGQHLRGSQGRP